MIRRIFDIIGEVLVFLFGALVWFWLLTAINYLFTDQPMKWSFIEMGIFGVIYLIAHVIEKYRESMCHHKNKKNRCVQCKQEEALKIAEFEESNRLSEIKRNANNLYWAEANRLNNLDHQRASNLLNLSPNEFEDSVAMLYKDLGYTVTQTPYVNDGGKDAIAFKDGVKYLIECKRYGRDNTIGRPMLQKLHAAMIDERATKGIFVTTSSFTSTSIEYGQKYDIELVDGDKLGAMYREIYPSAETDLSYRQMCYDCGDVVRFLIHDDDIFKHCRNGHAVGKRIPVSVVTNKSSYKKPTRKRYYR